MLKDRQYNIKTTDKKMKKPNASEKSKEVQLHPQADPQLHHICFCPTAPKTIQL